MTTLRPPGHARYARASAWIGVVTLFMVAAAWAVVRGADDVERAALRALEHLPADTACGETVGQLATLAQGGALGAEACRAELAGTPFPAAILTRIARDPARPVQARASALAALLAARTGPPGLASALVAAPTTSPEMRRAAFASTAGAPDEAVWAERGMAVAVHGLYDRALARLFVDGDPGMAEAVRAALAASASRPDPEVLAAVYAGLGTDRATLEEAVARHARGQLPLGLPNEWREAFWRHGCEEACVPLLLDLLAIEADRRGEEPAPPPPTLPGAEEALDLLYADEGAAGDHLRAELTAVAGWIARADEARRAARLVAAVLHPDAVPPEPAAAAAEAGDPHAALVRGGGSPAATALVANDLALAARVPLSAWATDRGVALQVAGRIYVLEACTAPHVTQGAGPDWQVVPRGGLDALAFVESAGRALRRGDVASARARVDTARARWPVAPGVDALDAAVLAREGLVVAAVPVPPPPRGRRTRAPAAPPGPAPVRVGDLVGLPAPGTLFVSLPTVGRGSAPPDPRMAERTALVERAERILALATEPGDRVRAAWWAVDGGHAELARRLVVEAGDPGALPPALRALREAVLRALGEPVGETPAAASPTIAPGADGAPDLTPSAADSPAPASAPPCFHPYRADPPPAAWAAAGARADG